MTASFDTSAFENDGAMAGGYTMLGDEAEFESLLVHLRDDRGFDFTGYKRASLARRIDLRLRQLEMTSYTDYRDLLEVRPDEFTLLFNTILINVTSFFRDPDAWDHLQTEVLPRICRRPQAHRRDPDLERRLRLRRGGLHAGHGASPRRSVSSRSATG